MTHEMTTFLAFLIQGALFCACWQWLLRRRDREIRYLRSIAGSQDQWRTPCRHCGKPIRDRHVITRYHDGATRGSRIIVAFHGDRTACRDAEAAYQPAA